ncbi:restriction endonuclease subunit S [Lysobacter cavernae]|uniref:Restriction endonuclease subunit S n=1 Tax=Lysobacter cavernae TaxID=1685901 RepID=A0ABV7RLS7_9GAMM
MSDDSVAEVPPSWSKSELSGLADLMRGVSYKKEDASSSPASDSVPLIRATNITGSSLTFDGLVHVPKRYVSSDQIIRRGDIVIASSSGSKDVVGKAGQMVAEFAPVSFGAFCTVIRPAVEVDPRYVGYYFESPEYRSAISEISAGSNINNIKSSELALHVVPVAPRAEQTRIVEKLEELLSDLDAGVAELKAAQRKLAQYRQSLLKAAVEGALTADWRAARIGTVPVPLPPPLAGEGEGGGNTTRAASPHHAPPSQPSPASGGRGQGETGADLLQRILSERRARWEQKQLARFADQGKTPPKDWQAKYPQPIEPDLSDLPPLPDGWTWATIDQVAHVGTGVTPLRSKRAYFDGGEIPWTTSGALNDEFVTSATEYVTQAAVDECRLQMYPAGTLLVAMYGEGKTRGKCAELTFSSTINQAIAAIVFEQPAIEARSHVRTFLLDAYEAMRKQASGGVQPNLNLQIVKALAVPLPSPFEQVEIAVTLNAALAAVKEQQAAIEHALTQAAAQRKNILKSAFAGQLVPQDPNDEPASALLARIRATRAADGSITRKRGRKAKENA